MNVIEFFSSYSMPEDFCQILFLYLLNFRFKSLLPFKKFQIMPETLFFSFKKKLKFIDARASKQKQIQGFVICHRYIWTENAVFLERVVVRNFGLI